MTAEYLADWTAEKLAAMMVESLAVLWVVQWGERKVGYLVEQLVGD